MAVKDFKGEGPRADKCVCLWIQAGFQVKLPGQSLAPDLEVGLAQKWVGKLVSFPLLILELELNG